MSDIDVDAVLAAQFALGVSHQSHLLQIPDHNEQHGASLAIDELDDSTLQDLLSEDLELNTRTLPDTRSTSPVNPDIPSYAGYIRDRYEQAGIATYGTSRSGRRTGRECNQDLIQRQHRSRRFAAHQNHQSFPSGLSKIVAPSIQQIALRNFTDKHPIRHPERGSPLLNMLGPDLILTITDWLYFPDAFVFAATCKSIYKFINLAQKKQQYLNRLIRCESVKSDTFVICSVCLYSLPEQYFLGPRRQSDGSAGLKSRNPDAICTDYKEMRLSLAKDEESKLKGQNLGRIIPPVWRPNSRIIIPSTGGRLWFRRRL